MTLGQRLRKAVRDRGAREARLRRALAWRRGRTRKLEGEKRRRSAALARKLRKTVMAAHRKSVVARRRLANFRKRQRARASDRLWGGSRAVTNEVIRIVDGRAAVTSRKRPPFHPLSRANPGSDHNAGNVTADAVDFAIAEAHGLKNEISRRLGGPAALADFGTFTIRRRHFLRMREYRVQIIAGTHGTGPHLHVGVRRIG